MNPAPLTDDELKAWSSYIHQLCGLYLNGSKAYLIETRLIGLMRETGSPGWSYLLSKVKSDRSNQLNSKVINAVTTKETSFFRDTAPFELFQYKLIPEHIDRCRTSGCQRVPIRILSAGCSTGEEVYTIAIVLKELLRDFSGYDIRILGIDISESALAKASYGHYGRYELDRGVSPDNFFRYFEPSGDRWKICDELRSVVAFKKTNLLETLMVPGQFDIIFCRNVAIYFNTTDKIRLFKNLDRVLAKNGALIIGATESLADICPEFEPKRYHRGAFYHRVSGQ